MYRKLLLVIFLFTLNCLFSFTLEAQTTVFTYQGRLTENNAAANGSYDMQFALFNAASDGVQQGNPQTITGVQVTGGSFSVQLDFTQTVFAIGADRYLEIRIKKPMEANYAPLQQRQRITSAPYAIQSLNAATAQNSLQLGGAAANQYVLTSDTRLSNARNPLPGSSSYIQNQSASQQPAEFNVNGTGKANIFDATQYNANGFRILSIPGTNNLFIGVNAGKVNTGSENAFVGRDSGENNSSGYSNTFLGNKSGSSNTTGFENTFFGDNAGRDNSDGNSNSFFGKNAGLLSKGNLNTFFGTFAGESNTTGSFNTVLGALANVGTGDLTFATVVGSGAVVNSSNTVVLGRSVDTVRVPGELMLANLAGGGNTALCRIPATLKIGDCSSSLRYKTNIKPFDSGLNLVNRLKPITFDWKEGGLKDLGLGAEDVALVEPRLVTYNSKGEVEGVKYDRIGVVLLNAVKEQQAQIEVQEQTIKTQQQQLEEQKTTNQNLQIKIEKQQQQIDALLNLVCSQHQKAAVCKQDK